MEVQQDFKELFELFNTHDVEYLIVGGYALAFHGAPRYTGDIDIFIKPDIENARKIIKVLDIFGFGTAGLTTNDFTTKDQVVQLGAPPVRVDILTSISGVTWNEAKADRIVGKYGDTKVWYIGREHFIQNKRATGRMKDYADIEALGGEIPFH